MKVYLYDRVIGMLPAPPKGTTGVSLIRLFKEVAASGGLVRNEKGEYLLIYRLGHWDLPKGKIDKEDEKAARRTGCGMTAAHLGALREVKEETGLHRLRILRELAPTRHLYQVKGIWCLKTTRWFEMEGNSGDTPTPQTTEQILLAKWVSRDELEQLLPMAYASVREVILASVT